MTRFFSLVLFLLCLIAMPLSAQQEEAEEALQEESQQDEEGMPDLDSGPLAELDADEEEIEQDSPIRFIPSEQISQDLGVSFPADI